MTPETWLLLAEVLGIPGAIVIGALFLRSGKINAGADVSGHFDALQAEVKALESAIELLEQKRALDIRTLHKRLDVILEALNAHKLTMERRMTRMETKINGETA